jgi:Ca-activated chloride channel homolog
MFAHPWRLLWLLPVLILGFYWMRNYAVPRAVDARVWQRLAREGRPGRQRGVAFLRWFALLCWLIAWAGPRWGVERIRVERTSYDIVFAVDCSRSMLAEDLAPSRKLAARQELTELMRRLEGNRFGLVGFTDEAYVFCPLTRDSGAATLFLEQLEENSFPRQGTRLAAALQTAGSLFPGRGEPGSRIVVLLSDGEDHGSNPAAAAKELAQRNIVVYTVALGSAEGAPIPMEDGDFHRDREGRVVTSKADEKTLQQIAQLTGGQYLRLASNAEHLDPLVQAIQEQDKRRLTQELSSRRRHQYSWFVALGLLCLGLAQLLVPRRSA